MAFAMAILLLLARPMLLAILLRLVVQVAGATFHGDLASLTPSLSMDIIVAVVAVGASFFSVTFCRSKA